MSLKKINLIILDGYQFKKGEVFEKKYVGLGKKTCSNAKKDTGWKLVINFARQTSNNKWKKDFKGIIKLGSSLVKGFLQLNILRCFPENQFISFFK